MSILLAIDNGFQACLMAPTEILANQHFIGLSELASKSNYYKNTDRFYENSRQKNTS
jgi:RecG-like helicase